MRYLIICLLCLAATQAALATGPTLPVFPDGDWKGAHAVYQCETFRAVMDKNGTLNVQVLDAAGEPVGKPFVYGKMSCNYHIPNTLNSPARPVVSYTSPAEPSMQPSRIVLEGLLKDDVRFRVEYEFRGQTITVSGACDDPRGIEYPSRFSLSTGFRSNWTIHPYVPQIEREDILAGCFLHLKEDRGGRSVTSKNPYWDVMRFHGSIKELEIEGAYGERLVNIAPRGVGLSGHLRPGFCPWSGFSISSGCPNNTLNPRGSIKLSVK